MNRAVFQPVFCDYRLPVKCRQYLGAGEIAFGDWLAVFIDDQTAAQIFEQNKPVLEIAGVKIGHGKPRLLQNCRNTGKRADVFGEMGNLAVGLAIPDGWPVGLPWRIHQYAGFATVAHRFIGARRCISLKS